MDLYVVRHAQALRQLPDPPLTDLGQQQAAQLASWLGEHSPFEAIYCSDLQRAQLTASPLEVVLGVSVQAEARLREFQSWSLAGSPHEPDKLHELTTSGAESWEFFCKRVEKLLREQAEYHAGKRVLWITHGGVLSVLVARSSQWRPLPTRVTPSHHTGCSRFGYDPAADILQQHFHDSTHHLSGASLTA